MRIPHGKREILAALRWLQDRISPFAFGHAVAVAGHWLHSDALALAAELVLLLLYSVRKH